MPTVELAHFNRKVAIPTYAILIIFLLACFIIAVFATINGDLLRPYGWCIPIFGIASLIYLPKFISTFRNCLKNKGMIYVVGDNLIAFDRSLVSVPVRDILNFTSAPTKNSVIIKTVAGERRVKLTLSVESPEEVSEKFWEFQSQYSR